MNKLSCQCWSCGLCCTSGEDLAYHLLANSTCAYEYRADGCLWRGHWYVGTAHVRLCRSEGNYAAEPWLVEALCVQPLRIDWINRFTDKEQARCFAKRLNDTSLLPLHRYCQVAGRVG